MNEDPFIDDDGRSSRDSHTARLAYVRVQPEARWPGLGRWLIRLLTAAVVVVLIIWFALPPPRVRQFPERIAVRFWHQWTGERQPLINAIVAAFNRSQTRYEVVALAVPGAVSDQKLLLAIAGGDPPDVMTQWGPTIGTWAADGLLQPLEDQLSAEDHRVLREDAFPIVLKAGTCSGHLYGLAVGLNAFACYYRPDLVRAVGLDPDRFPDTLEGLVEWGRRLDRVDRDGQLERIGFLPARLSVFAPLFGGGFTARGDGNLTIEDAGNQRALDFIGEAYRHYGFERVVHFRASLNTGGLAVEWPFISGQLPVTMDGQWRVEQLATYAPEVEYRTAALPPPAGGRVRAGFGTANLAIIPIGARQVPGAIAFMRFWSGLADAARPAAFHTSGGWLPPLRTTVRSPDFQAFLSAHPQFRTFVDLIDSPGIESVLPVPYQVYFNHRLWAAEDHVVRGGKSAAEALHDLAHEIGRERQRRARSLDVNDALGQSP